MSIKKQKKTSTKKQKNVSSKSVKDEPIPPDDLVGQIYRIKNLVNGKRYIGQTRNYFINHGKYRPFGYEKRFKDHISEALNNVKKKQCYKLNCAIRKYGKDKFHVKLIRTCSVEKLDEYEKKYIKKYDSYKNGYNLTKGGNGAKMNSGIRKKLSKATKKYFENEDNLKKQAIFHWQKYDSDRLNALTKMEINKIKIHTSGESRIIMIVQHNGGNKKYTFTKSKYVSINLILQRISRMLDNLINNDILEYDDIEVDNSILKDNDIESIWDIKINKKLFKKPKIPKKNKTRKRPQTYVDKYKEQRIKLFRGKKITYIMLGKRKVQQHFKISATLFYKNKNIGSTTFGGKHDTLEETTKMIKHFMEGLIKQNEFDDTEIYFTDGFSNYLKTLDENHEIRKYLNY